MQSHRIAIVGGFFLSSVLAVSCQGDPRFKPVVPVSGKVFYEGKPVAGATIQFHAVGVPDHPWTKPAGMTDEEGVFTVNTYREHDGMPEGKYEVGIFWIPLRYAGPIEAVNKLPARYADPKTSGLTAEIKSGENVLPTFHLSK